MILLRTISEWLECEIAYQSLIMQESINELDILTALKVSSAKIDIPKETLCEDTIVASIRLYNTIQAIQEEDTANKTSVIDKFLDILKGIRQKFTEFATKQTMKIASALNGKRDKIIELAKKSNVEITMPNYKIGTTRILNYQIKDFNSIKDSIKDTDTENIKHQVGKALLPDYTDFNVDFKTFCRQYFIGGKEINKVNSSALDIKEIYDYVTNYSKNIVTKIDTTIAEKIYSASNTIKAEVAKAENVAKTSAPAQQAQPAKPTEQTKHTNDSADITLMVKNIKLALAEEGIYTEADTAQQAQSAKPAEQTKTEPAKFEIKANNPAKDTQQTTTSSNTANTVQNITKDNKKDTNEIKKLKLAANAYISQSVALVSAIQSAADEIFMKYKEILNYFNNLLIQGTQSNNDNLKIDNPAQMKERIEKAGEDQNERAKILEEIKKTNPNFNGTLQDVRNACDKLINQQKTAEATP